uniref:Uncharacterized protein n=1 Tax=Otus sunia TaxID=257818 RepID=A0A8C8ANH3_9STRI
VKPGIPCEAPAAHSLPTHESIRENESHTVCLQGSQHGDGPWKSPVNRGQCSIRSTHLTRWRNQRKEFIPQREPYLDAGVSDHTTQMRG